MQLACVAAAFPADLLLLRAIVTSVLAGGVAGGTRRPGQEGPAGAATAGWPQRQVAGPRPRLRPGWVVVASALACAALRGLVMASLEVAARHQHSS
jgi:hypothetical protein